MRGIKFLRLPYYNKIILQINSDKRFYCNEPKNKLRNVLKLHERGMYHHMFPETSANYITKLLNQAPQTVYAGFDPTANSLHIGNLLVLMNLLHWQRGGHQVIAVLGGATGLIGDPSHRSQERIAIDKKLIDTNTESIKQNILTIFDNHAKYFYQQQGFPLKPILILNNIEWYKDVNVIDFIRETGKHFRMGTMLNKSSVQSRLNSDTGMSFTEFSYQVFQAYDWLHLLKNHKCKFQIGGTDQLGNISIGHELISRTEKTNVFGFTLPLITSEGGKKFGKSVGNAVWLSPEKSSSFQLYQYFIRTYDSDVEKYLKLFTFLSLNEIDQIMKEHKEKPENRKAQTILADNVTQLVHGDEGLLTAKSASYLLYDKSLESLTAMTQEQISVAFEGANIVDLVYEGRMTTFDFAVKAKCFKTSRDAVRIITAGGFSYESCKVNNIFRI